MSVIIYGTNDRGQSQPVPITNEGHMEVAVHAPRLPFGSVHTESITPIFQTDAVYGLNSGQVTAVTAGSGSVTASDSLFTCSTGTTIYSQGVLLGRKRLRYRPGQGVVARYTAKFSTPVANSYQLAGVGHAEDGVYFGYGNTNDLSDTRFGILYVSRGVREVRTLTVSTGASAALNCTITLNGTAFSVPLTASNNVNRTAWEIATYAGYTGWDAYPLGATAVFVRKSAGPAAGAFSFAAGSTGAAATIAQTTAGVASTDVFVPQEEWNGDQLDGGGGSGAVLDPTKGNVYQLNIQYLGFGAIACQVEVVSNNNNADFVTVHTFKFPNSRTQSTFSNPSFPFTMAAYSAGSTTDVSVSAASFAGFVEGVKKLQGNRFSYFNSLTTVGATNLQALFTVYNMLTYAGRTNQTVINILDIEGALKHTSPCIFYLIKNGSLGGNPNFSQYATNSSSAWDTAATTVTYANNAHLVWTGHLGDTGEIDHSFLNALEEVTLQPGEWITLAARATTGTPAYVTGSINTREDQ